MTPGELRRIKNIQEAIKNEIRKEQLPDGRAVIELKKRRYAERITKLRSSEDNEEYRIFAAELLAEAASPEELLAAILQNHFKGELLERNYRDFSGRKKDRAFWENSAGRANEVQLLIGVGKLDGFGAVKMLDLFWNIAHVRKNRIGKIDCQDHRAFVYIDNEDAKKVLAAFEANPDAPPIGYAPLEVPPPKNYKPKSAETKEKPAKQLKRTPAKEKQRRLRDWVEKMSADIELKEKKAKGKNKKKKTARK